MDIGGLLRRLRRSPFVANTVRIFAGTAGAQVVVLGAAPVLSRLYSPSDYGMLAVFSGVLGMLSLVGSFNYELGALVAPSDREAKSAVVVAVALLVASTVILGGGLSLALLLGWLPSTYRAAGAMLLLVPLGLFLGGLYGILTQWCMRVRRFDAIARTKFTQSMAQAGVSLVFGVAGAGPIGLILGKILGQGGGWVSLYYRTLRTEMPSFKALEARDLLDAARRFRKFAFFTTPRRYLGEANLALPGLFLAWAYGGSAAGFYALASSTLQLPLNLIGNSVGAVYFAEAARLRWTDPARVRILSSRLFWTLLAIVVPVIAVLAAFGSDIFGLVFGAEWDMAGSYAVALSFGIGCRFVFKPLSNIFDIFERQWLSLILNILRVVLILSGFGLSLVFGWGPATAVGTYSVAIGLVYILEYIVARRVMR